MKDSDAIRDIIARRGPGFILSVIGEQYPYLNRIKPRRPYDERFPGYLESDQDYVLNNLDVCVEWLDLQTEYYKR